MLERNCEQSWRLLRVVYGVVPIVAGLDKFFGLLADWEAYLSPLALRVLPVSPATFMAGVGLIEIVAGVLVLTRFTRLAAYVVSAWLALIALNLLSTGRYFDIAVRDLVMAVGAFVLARLSEARARAPHREEVRAPGTLRPAHR
jgi:uncharacterized membrane protein YphA (DoxX/SURF4 family)